MPFLVLLLFLMPSEPHHKVLLPHAILFFAPKPRAAPPEGAAGLPLPLRPLPEPSRGPEGRAPTPPRPAPQRPWRRRPPAPPRPPPADGAAAPPGEARGGRGPLFI